MSYQKKIFPRDSPFSKCPNPECTKTRSNHTSEEVKFCMSYAKRSDKHQNKTNRIDTFILVCNELQARNIDGRFSEFECIKELVQIYPEHFPSVEHASKMFGNMHLNHKVDKIAGRYKLA